MANSVTDARKLFSTPDENNKITKDAISDVRDSLVKKVLSFIPSNVMPIFYMSNFFIAGGFIRDTINGIKPSDIDIWQINDKGFSDKKRIKERFKSIKSLLVKKGYKVKNESKYAITFKHKKGELIGYYPIQIMKKVAISPVDLISNFDFDCCKFAIWFDENKEEFDYVVGENAIKDTLDMVLNYCPATISSPSSSLLHLTHLLKKGYKITNESLIKILDKYEANVAQYIKNTKEPIDDNSDDDLEDFLEVDDILITATVKREAELYS